MPYDQYWQCSSCSSCSVAECLQWDACKLCVSVCENISSMRGPSYTLYIWLAGLQCAREGVPRPRRTSLDERSVVLHVSCPGPSIERAPPLLKAESCPLGPRCRLTRPWSCSPSPWQGMMPSYLRHAPPDASGAGLLSGRLARPPLWGMGGRAPYYRCLSVQGRAR